MRLRILALLATSATVCLALAGEPAAHAQPNSPGSTEPSGDTQPTFDLSFGGGTVGEYLDALGQIAIVNVVAPVDVRTLAMPAVRLRGVTAGASVELVKNMFLDPSLGAVQLRQVAGDGTTTIYVLSVVTQGPPRQPPAPVTVNDVFSVGDVLRPSNEQPADLQVKQIFEMIDSAMKLAPAAQAPEMAYHDDTQMLVFRGSPEQQRLVSSVLARYMNSWQAASAQARSLRREIADLELDAKTSLIEAVASRSRVEFMTRHLDELKQMAAAGSVLSDSVAEADSSLTIVRAQAEIQAATAAHAQTRLAECQEALAALTPGQPPSAVVYDFRDLGARGERVAQAFKALLDAAELPGTRLSADAQGSVTLTANPAMHEAMRFVLSQVRSQTRPSGGR